VAATVVPWGIAPSFVAALGAALAALYVANRAIRERRL